LEEFRAKRAANCPLLSATALASAPETRLTHIRMFEPYQSAFSPRARDVLTEHFDLGADLYKFWASPPSVLRALTRGWARANHPSHLHYAWDLERALSLDEAILETTRRAVSLLCVEDVAHPLLFEPGCGIGGGVVQVAQMLPHAKVTGLSLVEKQLEIGRTMAVARGLPNTDFVHGNYLATPFSDAFFDGIFAIECLIYTPIAEKPALFREMFRLLRPGRSLVSFEPIRLRPPNNEAERSMIQDVLDGWTMPLPPTVEEFQSGAVAAGFEVVKAEDATAHVYASAHRIRAIAKAVLVPLSVLARIPLLGGLARPFGFQSLRHARRFVDACRSQVRVFDAGLGAYYVHVFRKPAVC
jgi:cyclopropane fatty-acyl-phospholipid synthase-like methyltransferase